MWVTLPGLNFFTMHNKIVKDFSSDAIFQELYAKAGGLDKILTEEEVAGVVSKYHQYLKAKYDALGEEITAFFEGAKYEPEVLTMSTPLTIATGVQQYKFTDYKVLQNTLLVDLCLPQANSFTTTMLGEPVLQFAQLCQCFITLTNDRQQKMVDREPLLNYIRDTAYWQGKGKFVQSRIDWDNSMIELNDVALATTYDGYVILPVVKYIDMKRYPYLRKRG